MSQLLRKIGKNVRYYRLKKNLTQEQLAKKSNFHRSYISHIEHAKRNIFLTTLVKLAEVLGVNPSDLVK